MKFLQKVCWVVVLIQCSDTDRLGGLKIPRVGGAEKLKLQEAIPPFSLMEDSIQGMRAEMLVKIVYSCWPQLSPSCLLMIPTRRWAPSSLTIESGPPLSPWVKDVIVKMRFSFQIHLAGPNTLTPCTQKMVLIHIFGLVHSLKTIVVWHNFNFSLLQLVRGGVTGVSPSWDRVQVSSSN